MHNEPDNTIQRHLYLLNEFEDYIKIPDLIPGFLYRIFSRNANLGIYLGESTHHAFLIPRKKMERVFLFKEHHWDFDFFPTVKPLENLEKAPFEVDQLIFLADKNHFDTYSIEYHSVLKYLLDKLEP